MNHHKKIVPKREGPFEIDEVLGPVTYRLKLPKSWKIHNVFHATLLRPYIKNKVYGNNYPRPLPKLLEGEEVYEVETILRHRRRGRGYQYYVKWKGYPITEATWEKRISLFQQWRHDSTIQRLLSTIGADWSIKNKRIEKEEKR
jgi:Chromo (CHRromatin Organisation MOdifier) domain